MLLPRPSPEQSPSHRPLPAAQQLFFFSKTKPAKVTTFNDYFNDRKDARTNKYLASKSHFEHFNRSKTESSLAEDLQPKLRLNRPPPVESQKLLKSTSQHVSPPTLTPKMRLLQHLYQPTRKKSSKTLTSFRPLSQATQKRRNTSNSHLDHHDRPHPQLQLIKEKVLKLLEAWKTKEQHYKSQQLALQQEIARLTSLVLHYERTFGKQ